MTRFFILTVTPILPFVLLLTACSNQTEEKKATQVFIPDSPSTVVQWIDTFITDSTPISTEKFKLNCNCSTNSYPKTWMSDISFQNHYPSDKINQEKFEKWSNDTLKLKVTSISFSHFDTIPEKFKVFINVEKVTLQDVLTKDWRQGKIIHGLDMFPKLKTVVFWGSSIHLDPTAKWLKKVEVLHAEKTNIQGIKDFSEIPNLHVLYLAYSSFNEFPKNIESLKCLSELTLGAYSFGNINLTDIDLSQLPCLKKLDIVTWSNNMTGIPEGLETSNLQTVKIHHQKLTQTEKDIIKKINHKR